MPYTFTKEFGSDVILAPCLQVLCAEIAASPKYQVLTNLGEIGDERHKGQGTASDHNPFVVHNGKGYIRAIDLGGDRATLLALRDELFALYRGKDRRVYPYGYFKGPDSLINDWPPGTGWHVDTGDEGHLHISVGQADGYNPSAGGWIRALEDRSPWGIGQPKPAPKPITTTTPYPYRNRPRDYIGDINGDQHSHGGINAAERAQVRFVFTRLEYFGYWTGDIPSVFTGSAMASAVKRFKIRNGLHPDAKVSWRMWNYLKGSSAKAAQK